MQIIGTPDCRLTMKDPYDGIIASLLVSVPSTKFRVFPKIVNSFVSTCSNPQMAELIIKIDSEDCVENTMLDKCISFLSKIPMKYKIVCYPKFQGYNSHIYFYNHLALLADGHTIWPMDVPILEGDWLSLFAKSRGTFEDNIYTINMVGNSTSKNGIPAISVEWFRFFGCFAPINCGDRFVRALGYKINRIIHDHTVIFRHRSKRTRKLRKALRIHKSVLKDLIGRCTVGYVDLFQKKYG